MSIANYFQHKTLPSLGLLGLRVVVGLAFVQHGLPKIANATGWMGDAIPPVLQAFAAYSEVVGGALLALGLLTPLATLALIGTMCGALFMYHIPNGDPFVGDPSKGSFELAAVYLSTAILFLLNSPGKFSLDYVLMKALKPGAFQRDAMRLQS